jgi:hypothetical protein
VAEGRKRRRARSKTANGWVDGSPKPDALATFALAPHGRDKTDETKPSDTDRAQSVIDTHVTYLRMARSLRHIHAFNYRKSFLEYILIRQRKQNQCNVSRLSPSPMAVSSARSETARS